MRFQISSFSFKLNHVLILQNLILFIAYFFFKVDVFIIFCHTYLVNSGNNPIYSNRFEQIVFRTDLYITKVNSLVFQLKAAIIHLTTMIIKPETESSGCCVGVTYGKFISRTANTSYFPYKHSYVIMVL